MKTAAPAMFLELSVRLITHNYFISVIYRGTAQNPSPQRVFDFSELTAKKAAYKLESLITRMEPILSSRSLSSTKLAASCWVYQIFFNWVGF